MCYSRNYDIPYILLLQRFKRCVWGAGCIKTRKFPMDLSDVLYHLFFSSYSPFEACHLLFCKCSFFTLLLWIDRVSQNIFRARTCSIYLYPQTYWRQRQDISMKYRPTWVISSLSLHFYPMPSRNILRRSRNGKVLAYTLVQCFSNHQPFLIMCFKN